MLVRFIVTCAYKCRKSEVFGSNQMEVQGLCLPLWVKPWDMYSKTNERTLSKLISIILLFLGNRPYNRPGYDGRPNYNYIPSNYQSNYPGYRPGYNQYRPGFDRPYQGNGYYDGVRDGYDNFGLLGRKVSEIKKDDAWV